MPKKNKRKKLLNKNEIFTNNKQADFDYDKLAIAIVKAQEQSKKIKEELLENENKQKIKEWHEIIGYKEHSYNESWIKCKLLNVRNSAVVFFHFLFFNKKYAKSDAMTYALLQMATSSIFSVCKWILYYISVMCTHEYMKLLCESSDVIKEIYILYACVAFVFARIFRIVVFEIENMKDKKNLITIFSATTCFVAMIIAIIALFV